MVMQAIINAVDEPVGAAESYLIGKDAMAQAIQVKRFLLRQKRILVGIQDPVRVEEVCFKFSNNVLSLEIFTIWVGHRVSAY